MATYSAKSTVGWRPSEVRDLVISGAIAAACWVLWATHVFVDFDGLLLGVAIVFTAAFTLGLFFNTSRKRNVTMFAEMNTEKWQVRWWARKPLKAVWGTRLSPLYNSGSLNDVQQINLTKVGIHTVFEFNVPTGKLTLPQRLANTDGVRDFLLAWVESNNGNINGTSRESVEAFVEVLNRGRELPGTMTERESEGDAEAVVEPVAVEVPAQSHEVRAKP